MVKVGCGNRLSAAAALLSLNRPSLGPLELAEKIFGPVEDKPYSQPWHVPACMLSLMMSLGPTRGTRNTVTGKILKLRGHDLRKEFLEWFPDFPKGFVRSREDGNYYPIGRSVKEERIRREKLRQEWRAAQREMKKKEKMKLAQRVANKAVKKKTKGIKHEIVASKV